VRNFIREKRIYCGPEHLEVDIYQITEAHLNRKGKRSKKRKESLPKQKNLNEKMAKRKIRQMANSNFTQNDIMATYTYLKKIEPKTLEEALEDRRKLIERLKYHMDKLGIELKYIAVTEYGGTEEEPSNIHHHIILNKGLDRDKIEDLWSTGRGKKRKKLGTANTKRLQLDEAGLAKIAGYIVKKPEGKKRWTTSQNLERPESRCNDHKYSRRDIIKASLYQDRESIYKKYPGYEPIDYDNGFNAVYNEYTGWSIYLRLRRKGSG